MNSKEKTPYVSPVLSVIRIAENDVIMTSTGKDNDYQTNETFWN